MRRGPLKRLAASADMLPLVLDASPGGEWAPVLWVGVTRRAQETSPADAREV